VSEIDWLKADGKKLGIDSREKMKHIERNDISLS